LLAGRGEAIGNHVEPQPPKDEPPPSVAQESTQNTLKRKGREYRRDARQNGDRAVIESLSERRRNRVATKKKKFKARRIEII
jgi:hypothetical protein